MSIKINGDSNSFTITNNPEINNEFTHVVDWDKIQDIDDVVELLKGLDMRFNPAKCNPKIHKLLTPIIH